MADRLNFGSQSAQIFAKGAKDGSFMLLRAGAGRSPLWETHTNCKPGASEEEMPASPAALSRFITEGTAIRRPDAGTL